jgi:hypothetical protein
VEQPRETVMRIDEGMSVMEDDGVPVWLLVTPGRYPPRFPIPTHEHEGPLPPEVWDRIKATS